MGNFRRLTVNKNTKSHLVVGDFNILHNNITNNEENNRNIINLEFLDNFLENEYTPSILGITWPSHDNHSGTC